ncbi:MAG: GNAT family N-acetyltransferase [Gemmataceae bacterium]|nr:GNAT family N-acetyltransferase [Gemmataceae bacterium]
MRHAPSLAERAARPAAPPPPSRDYAISLVQKAEGLRPHVEAWDDLARHALEPNAFNEPWCFLPAMEAFAGPEAFVLLVFAPDGQMAGFFPLATRRLHPLVPLTVLESWRHVYSFLTIPLVRAGHEARVLSIVFDWFRASGHGASLWRLERMSGDGPFARSLADLCRERQRPVFVSESHNRAFMTKHPDGADAYLDRALSKKRAREVRRKDRSLAGKGRLEHRLVGPEEDCSSWAEDFLALEAAGWKGREGTALASHPRHAGWFRATVRDGHASGRLQLTGLYLDERPIALKCNYLCPPGAFAFKIAYDESMHAQSPGVVLENDNIARFHAAPELCWMDSCAVPGHPMIDKLWTERRLVQDLWVATGRKPGDLAVSLMPLARWLKRLVCPPRNTAPLSPPSEEP